MQVLMLYLCLIIELGLWKQSFLSIPDPIYFHLSGKHFHPHLSVCCGGHGMDICQFTSPQFFILSHPGVSECKLDLNAVAVECIN